MKKLLSLVLLFLIGCSSPEPINIEMLIERDGVYYTKDTNQPYSGPVFTLYEEKFGSGIKDEYTLVDGYIDGSYKGYDTQGQLEFEGNMKDGSLDGTNKWYNGKGQLIKEKTYKDGKIIGIDKRYYDNGQLKEERTYKDGEIIDIKRY